MLRQLLIVLLVSLPSLPLAGSERSLAIVSLSDAASSVSELVMVELSTDDSIKLVEREQYDLIAKEQKLAVAGQVNARVSLGGILGADILALIDANKANTSLVICDCKTGARIGRASIPRDDAVVSRHAASIREALKRFPDGVTSVVAVSDYLCRDLESSKKHLEKDYAELIRTISSRLPGVAVVEIDEVRSIATEIELTGGTVRRVVPLVVTGEFRTERNAEDGLSVRIKTRLRQGRQPSIEIDSGSIPLDKTGEHLLNVVCPRAFKQLRAPARPVSAIENEFAILIDRADQFSEVGDLKSSSALREVALLLKPDSREQRSQLARDYADWNARPLGLWPADLTSDADRTVYLQNRLSRTRADWDRSLQHVEYLIRHRKVDLAEATDLMYRCLRSINRSRASNSQLLGPEEIRKKAFLRQVVPLLFKLDNAGHPATQLSRLESASTRVFELAFSRVDGNFVTADDLALVRDLLRDLIPADVPHRHILVYRSSMKVTSIRISQGESPIDVWQDFARDLMDTDRPLVHAYGRLVALKGRWLWQRVTPSELIGEAEALVKSFKEEPLKSLDHNRIYAKEAESALWRIKQAAEREEARPLASRPPPFKPSTVQPPFENPRMPLFPKRTVLRPYKIDERLSKISPDANIYECDRLRIKPVECTVALPDGNIARLIATKWLARGAAYKPWRSLIPAWEGIDVIYSSGNVLWLEKDRVARIMFSKPDEFISHVVFDGRHVWVSCQYDKGVYALDRTGKVVAHLRGDDGLPVASNSFPIAVLGEGRIMVAGSIPGSGRGWLAMIELNGNAKSVNVFHEAVKSFPNDLALRLENLRDPLVRFSPQWLAPHVDENGKQWVFVGRSVVPLVVDVAALEVSAYPTATFDVYFPRLNGPANAFLSHGGNFYVADSKDLRRFRFDTTELALKQTFQSRELETRLTMSQFAGRVFRYDGRIHYFGGSSWGRYDPEMNHDEVLVRSPDDIPQGKYEWSFADSQTFGLVGWCNSRLYQIEITD